MGRINAFKAVIQLKNDTVTLHEYPNGIDPLTGLPDTTMRLYDTVMVFNNPMPKQEWVKYTTKPQGSDLWNAYGERTEMLTDIRSIYFTRFPKAGVPHVVITGDGTVYRTLEIEHRPHEGKYVLVVGRTYE